MILEIAFSVSIVKPLQSLPFLQIELVCTHIFISVLCSKSSTEPVLWRLMIILVVESSPTTSLITSPLVASSHLRLSLVLACIHPSTSISSASAWIRPLHKLNFTAEHTLIVQLSISWKSSEKLFDQDRGIFIDLLERLPRCRSLFCFLVDPGNEKLISASLLVHWPDI